MDLVYCLAILYAVGNFEATAINVIAERMIVAMAGGIHFLSDFLKQKMITKRTCMHVFANARKK
ncbi:MAG: hypothetical protein ACI9GC_001162 [Phycisphaerales bacterium]|jgi:hypothetical protein